MVRGKRLVVLAGAGIVVLTAAFSFVSWYTTALATTPHAIRHPLERVMSDSIQVIPNPHGSSRTRSARIETNGWLWQKKPLLLTSCSPPNRQDLHYDLKYYRTALEIIGFTRNDAYLVQVFSFTFTIYPHYHRAAHVGFKARSATIRDSRKGDGDPCQMSRSATPRDRFRHLATRAQSVVNLPPLLWLRVTMGGHQSPILMTVSMRPL